jgi:HK97 family phage prohead protease
MNRPVTAKAKVKTMAREQRMSGGSVEFRKDESGESIGKLVGYAARFYDPKDAGTEYDIGYFIERIDPGAFDEALKDGEDVRALFNHDSDIVLGRSVAGTLRLEVDKLGLRYEIDLPDTTAARDLKTSIERGDISGSSFAFEVKSQTWTEEPERFIRTINDVHLFDVGPVTYPAYSATEVDARSLEEFKASNGDQAKQAKQELIATRAKYRQRIAQARSLELNA